MHKRILIDNCIISYLKDIFFNKPISKTHIKLLFEKASLVYLSNIKTLQLEFLLSEESLMEIEKMQSGSKKAELQAVYYAFKKNRPVIKNRSVSWDDPDTTWDSPDVHWGHESDDNCLNQVKKFFQNKGNASRFDPGYIAYAMLPENKIDVFLTFDNGIWDSRKEIENQFKVKVMKPSELADYYKYVR